MRVLSGSLFPGLCGEGRRGQCGGECVHACAVVCCPTLKNSKPCETPPSTPVVLGCSKCLFMSEAGMGRRCQSFCRRFPWWWDWPGLGLQEHCRRNWFPDCRGICTFVFDQKGGGGGEGSCARDAQPPMPRRRPWALSCDLSPGREFGVSAWSGSAEPRETVGSFGCNVVRSALPGPSRHPSSPPGLPPGP